MSREPVEASDDVLVAALRDRDETAYLELVRRHTPLMLRVARSMVGGREATEDVVQDTWVAVLRSVDRFEGRSSFRTWLMRILVNTARRRRMRDARTVCWSTSPGDAPVWDAVLGPAVRRHARPDWTARSPGSRGWPSGPRSRSFRIDSRWWCCCATSRAPAPQRCATCWGCRPATSGYCCIGGELDCAGCSAARTVGRTPTPGEPDMPRPDPGVPLPDITLPDTAGVPRRIGELAAGDPLIVHTYRGWFCPKDRAYFRQVLLPLQEVAEVGYVRMVSVSVEPPEVTAAFRAGLDARWTFLSDVDRTWQSALDLREITDTVHDPYIPTVSVCDPDLTVRRAYDGYWMWGRPSLADLWADLRAAGATLRPDWVAPHA